MIELPTLYHLATPDAWDAEASDDYTVSTLGRSLAEEGFIHLSLARQVSGVAEAFYAGRDVILLALDPHRLSARVEFEQVPGVDDAFPHLYGPIPRAAILSATPVPFAQDGAHDFTGLLPEPL
ncbi:DUF952 domain-containing protein [Demequina mangrovi]|uniref:Uncharacterized conserved protein, DUF952 family n=1 Tax=Demequina mangrovi TaxID=1043493 RepID=A0A1H6ZLN9_9MICO|nr:DUF952 domain-containing protein [Demequina mangrovi]SEJ50612.1 Uncharacterized conserved protein, DUF952 family [Demequina mangrovi]